MKNILEVNILEVINNRLEPVEEKSNELEDKAK